MDFLDGRSPRAHMWMTLGFWMVVMAIIPAAKSMLFSSAVFISFVAVGIRRLNDIHQSRWWILLTCIPLLNLIQIIYFLFKPSAAGQSA